MDNNRYIVSARKYRPATFRTVVGQKNLTTTLKNAIRSQRLAQAYLFCGPRGVGKTSCARIFAKNINCLSPDSEGEACGVCENCIAIDNGSSFNIIELDAASNNGVDQIRTLTEQVHIPPQQGNYRVFIIDEVHMLSSAAFNAFLKTLEEPPSYVIFILATTEKHKVIPTILSRCQIYDFKRITVNDMAEHLAYVASQEGITADPAALNVIARKADGAMRDALSIFDQVAASTQGNLTYDATIANLNVLDYDYYFRLVDAFRASDAGSSLLLYKEVRDKGFDSQFFINGLAEHIRDLMVAADPRTLPLLEVADDVAHHYHEQSKTLPPQWFYHALKLLNDCDRDYRQAASKRLLVELTLIRLCQLLTPTTPPFDSIDYTPPLQNPTSSASSSSPQTATPSASTSITTPPPTSTPATSLNSSGQPQPQQPQPQAEDNSISNHRQQAKPTPPIQRHRTTRTPRISISATESQETSHSSTKRNTPYTPEQFANAWQSYILSHGEQIQLCNGMKADLPKQDRNNQWIVTASQPSIYSAFETNLNQLTTFLRDTLKNDDVSLRIQLAPQTENERRLSPKEFLDHINETNKTLASALLELDCEIDT